MSPIGQNIGIPKTNRFSEKIPDHNWQSHGQHDHLHYQPQHAIHNHSQNYHHDRKIQQSYSKDDYDRDKGGSHGMIHSGVLTPEK